MDTRQLRYMIDLAETLHFGHSAQRMHIAQSAFSTQIARLERQIGATLFDRSANRVTLTPAGEAFLLRARQVLAQVADASLEARAIQAAKQDHLRIGLFCGSAGELTPLIINAFRQALPETTLTFRELSMTDQVEVLATDQVDIALIRSPIEDTRIIMDELFAEPRLVGIAPDHELAGYDHVTSEQLVEAAFAVAAPESPHKWRAYWACDDLRGSPGRIAASVTNVPESLNAIAYQGAVDTFPASATRFLNFPRVVYRPLVDVSYSPIAIATRKGDHRAHVEAFRRIGRQLAQTSLSIVPDAVPVDQAPPGTPTTG